MTIDQIDTYGPSPAQKRLRLRLRLHLFLRLRLRPHALPHALRLLLPQSSGVLLGTLVVSFKAPYPNPIHIIIPPPTYPCGVLQGPTPSLLSLIVNPNPNPNPHPAS